MHPAKTSRRFISNLLFATTAVAALLFLQTRLPTAKYLLEPISSQASSRISSSKPDVTCPKSDIQEDVLVVLRTGGTRAQTRIPTHLNTTLQCIPHYAIFSDVTQDIGGVRVLDVLKDLGDTFRNNATEFQFYTDLQAYHRQGRPLSELAPRDVIEKEDNMAWKLDKWKFIPMIEKAVQMKPDANWYVFIEDDMYLVWPNLLRLLDKLDAADFYYLGGQNWIDGIEFGNGGAGIIMSSTAAHMFVQKIQDNRLHYEQLTLNDCCGDFIVAKIFLDLDIALTRTWPILQGETPSSLDFSSHHWCHPAATYHHMSNDEITQYWDFEQRWLKSWKSDAPIMHRDAFEHLIEPLSNSIRQAWDNMSQDKTYEQSTAAEEGSEAEQNAYTSLEACAAACEASERCLQYSYEDGTCRHGHVLRLGRESNAGIQSGWVSDKIKAFKASQEPCQPQWVLA